MVKKISFTLLTVILTAGVLYYLWGSCSLEIPQIADKLKIINGRYVISIIILIIAMILLSISHPSWLMPSMVFTLLIIIAIFAYESLGGIKNISKYFHPKEKMASSTPNGKVESSPPEWEMVKDCPIHFSGRIFSGTVGPNGERANTGEIYSGCFLESGYDYKITYSGTYSEFFVRNPWYDNISWQGWTPQSQGMNKPFSNYDYGALTLRIGNREGLHPDKGKDFIIFTPTEAVKIFAELNINREDGEYHHPIEGTKIKNSTLSLKLERRPL